jgi:hypothetical protein
MKSSVEVNARVSNFRSGYILTFWSLCMSVGQTVAMQDSSADLTK